MKRISAVVLLAVFCTFQAFSGSGRDNSSGTQAQSLKPSEGGELRFGLISEPATLDPLSSSNTADGRSILFNVFEGLVKPESDGGLKPAIAESYTIEQNGLVYNFRLRQGVRFHDGSAVTAEDVEFTLDTAVKAGYTGFTQISTIEITGDSAARGIRITLKAPDVEFLPYLTLGIVPKNNANRETNAIGTGPYKIESYNTQRSLVLVKNTSYWGAAPHLDKITIVFAADSEALLLGLQGGNIDAAAVIGSQLDQIDQRRFNLHSYYSNAVQLFALNNAVKPFDDVRVRQAVNYAVDIQGIINAAFFGKGTPSGSPLIPGLSRYYEASLKDPYPVNIDRAKALLREAGYPNGFNLEITVPSNYGMHVDTAQVLVNQLARAGITARIKQVDWATWLSDTYRGRQFETTVISFDSSNISPRGFLSRYRSSSGSNFISYKSEAFDAAYSAVLEELDDARRAALYRQMQKIMSDEAASVFIQDIEGFYALPKNFGGLVNYPLYVIDFSTVYQLR
ncbi:diguanylate phosphodiesterase [Spirochaetia bacterium]|nr:diguanylate phosphodiesterase [Spirochaetia bacterium]